MTGAWIIIYSHVDQCLEMYPFWQEPGIDRSLRIVGCSGLQFVKSTNVVMVEPAASSLVDMHWNQGSFMCYIVWQVSVSDSILCIYPSAWNDTCSRHVIIPIQSTALWEVTTVMLHTIKLNTENTLQVITGNWNASFAIQESQIWILQKGQVSLLIRSWESQFRYMGRGF